MFTTNNCRPKRLPGFFSVIDQEANVQEENARLDSPNSYYGFIWVDSIKFVLIIVKNVHIIAVDHDSNVFNEYELQ